MKSLEMDKGVVERCDSLFFLQLFLPICDPKMSGIAGNPRVPFFTKVCKFTNTYASQKEKLGATYGQKFTVKYVELIVRYFGLKLRHGLLSNRALIESRFQEWDPQTGNKNEDYCPYISKSMTYSTYRQIQITLKLNDNQIGTVKKGSPYYDPSA